MVYGRIFSSVLPLVATLLLTAPVSRAATVTLLGNLTGSNEVPQTGSPGTGQATVVLDEALNTLAVDVTFSGLLSGTTASHIHCCLATPFATGVNVGVATTTPTFTDFPLGVTSGHYSRVLDLLSATSYNPAFVTANGGLVANAEAALIAGLLAGETYLNIHTAAFPTGEIRGFLIPTPLPGALALFGTVLLGVAGIRRLRRRDMRLPSRPA
jgi:CHRD domain